MRLKIKIIAIIAFALIALAFLVPTGSMQTTAPQQAKPETAGQKFKNVKVLTEMPADQMGKVMNMMSASLGVDCKFCHVSNDKDFENENSEHKATARDMIKMVFELNKTYFNGRPEINCNSCHNGRSHPQPTFPLAPPVAVERPKQPDVKPTGDAIFEKYAAAIGGKDAAAKIKSRWIKATRVEPDGKTTEPEEIWQKGQMMRTDTSYGTVVISEVFDGKQAFKASGGSRIELKPDETDNIRRDAQYFGNPDLRSLFAKAEFLRVDRINGQDAYIVRATTASGQRETLWFDIATGLLIRRATGAPTVLGNFVYQVDYHDYKDFGGIKLPTTINFAVPNIYWTRKIGEVKLNTPVEESKF